MANEINTDHRTFSAESTGELPDSSPVAKRAAAFREAQLAYNPSAAQLADAGIKVEAQEADQSQVVVPSASKIVVADSIEDLPEGSSGRRISEGVFEIFANEDTSRSDKSKEVVDSLVKERENQQKAEDTKLESDEDKQKSEPKAVLNRDVPKETPKVRFP